MYVIVVKAVVQLYCSGTRSRSRKWVVVLKCHSEWTVQLASSNDLRLVIVYRPQSDYDNHRIPIITSFNDFSAYLETVTHCKEQLVIVGDFNIHVDVLAIVTPNFEICWNLSAYNSMWWVQPIFMVTPWT